MADKRQSEKPKKAKRGVTRDQIREFQKERRGLETDLLDEVLKSRKVAWVLASASVVVAVAAFGLAGFTIHKYAQPIPAHILTLDESTGTVEQVALLPDEKRSYGEVVDTYWISQFVRHYESYDFYSIQADYDAVGLMASADVAEPYQSEFAGSKGKDKKLGDSRATRVRISSVILDRDAGTATVRFSTQEKYRDRPMPEARKEWIAIIGYEYRNVPLTASQRFINPLGFRVLSYRVQPVATGGN